MRAKSVLHVEYEVFNAILDSDLIAEVVEAIKESLVPEHDSVAEKRFEEGVRNAAKYIHNLAERRLHRLPEDHLDFKPKE